MKRQQRRITEADQIQEQDVNADHMKLYTCTYILKTERHAPSFNAAKYLIAMLFRGNAAGNLIEQAFKSLP
jgi:hypothetical protein